MKQYVLVMGSEEYGEEEPFYRFNLKEFKMWCEKQIN